MRGQPDRRRQGGGGVSAASAGEQLVYASDQLGDVLLEAVEDSEMAWTAHLHAAVRRLERALFEHRDAGEAPEGTLTALTEQKPALVEEADTQRAVHAELLGRTESLLSACDKAIAFDDANVEILRLDGQILYRMVRRHLAWESVLSYEAFFREEGGEG